MSNNSPDESVLSVTPPLENSSGLQIPEPKDGFFGYSEEMNFQQVTSALTSCPL
jgi:hypothetical protein